MNLSRLKNFEASVESQPEMVEAYSLRRVITHLFVCLIEVALVVGFVPLVFETNDDVIMNAIASGAMTGSPSEFLMFSNIIVGDLIKFLYQTAPGVNWYTWYIVASFTLGYVAIQHVFYHFKGDVWLKAIRHLLILGVLIHALFVLQFTRVGAVVAAGGFLLVLFNQRQSYRSFVLGGLLIVLAGVIRHQVVLMYVVLSIPFVGFLIFRQRWRKVIWLGGFVAASMLLNLYHQQVYNSNSEIAAYRTFNGVRSQVTTFDSPSFNYENKKTIADKLGWSENDFMLISNFNLDVGGDKFSTDNLKEAIAFESTEKPEAYQAVHTLKVVMSQFANFLISPRHLTVLLLLVFVVFIKRSLIGVVVFLFSYVLIVGFAVSYLQGGHLKPWVLFGLTLPLFLFMIYAVRVSRMVTILPSLEISVRVRKFALLAGVNLFVFAPIVWHLSIMPRAISERIERDEQVYNTIATYNDPLYVGWTSITHYNLFELPYDKSNAYGMGWRAGSPWNKQLIEEYVGQSDQGIFTIYNQPIVWYFRESNDLYFQNFRDYVLTFYKENYPDCEIEKEVIRINEYDTLYRYTFLIEE